MRLDRRSLVCCPINNLPKTRRESTPCCVTNPRQVCAPERGAGPLWACDRVGVHKNAVYLSALASRCRVASPKVGALQGGAGSIAVCAMDATPETRKGRPTRLGRLHYRIPASGAPAPTCAGPCSAVRGRTWLWFAPCRAPISRVSNRSWCVADLGQDCVFVCRSYPAN